MSEMSIVHLMWGVGFAPFVFAWRDNAGTTLRPTLAWALAAWLAWGAVLFGASPVTRFTALSLTGGAGVAVLGARRPNVAGWNFVVVALLVVLSLAWIEGLASGVQLHLGGFRSAFLGGVVATAAVNFLPTRLGLGAAALGVGCLFELGELTGHKWPNGLAWVFASPYLAWLGTLFMPHNSSADTVWTTFRDRFGAIWALRVREQFQIAAMNAERPVSLGWFGVNSTPNDLEWCSDTLNALTLRFRLQPAEEELRPRQIPPLSG